MTNQELFKKPFHFDSEFQNPEERAKSEVILDLGDHDSTAEAMEKDMDAVAALGKNTAQPVLIALLG